MVIHCDKTGCQSNNSKICCGMPCSNSNSNINMLDEMIRLAHEYVEEKDMEYVHAIWEAAEKLNCVELLKKAVKAYELKVE